MGLHVLQTGMVMKIKNRNNVYQLNLQEVTLKSGADASRSVSVDFENRDDIFNIIEVIEARNLFADKNESLEFVLGLKLLGEVILNNRNHPLFCKLKPAFIQFMQKVKKPETPPQAQVAVFRPEEQYYNE